MDCLAIVRTLAQLRTGFSTYLSKNKQPNNSLQFIAIDLGCTNIFSHYFLRNFRRFLLPSNINSGEKDFKYKKETVFEISPKLSLG